MEADSGNVPSSESWKMQLLWGLSSVFWEATLSALRASEQTLLEPDWDPCSHSSLSNDTWPQLL